MYNFFSIAMDRFPETGVHTRNMVKQANRSLLAPAKLSVQAEEHVSTPPHSDRPSNNLSEPAVQSELGSDSPHGGSHIQMQPSVPPTVVTHASNPESDSVPVDCGGAASPVDSAAPPRPGFRPIERLLVVCCTVCNVIYQRGPNQQSGCCPLCSAKKAHKTQYSEDLN